MGVLGRLFGRGAGGQADEADQADRAGGAHKADEAGEPDPTGHAAGATDEAERARELRLLREEQGRLDDLGQRQLRYAQHAWRPPAQGGERRADDDRGQESGAG